MEEEKKKAYGELKKKYPLPEFSEINAEYEISTLENAEFLLRRIKERITEKLEFIGQTLGAILQPDTNSVADMHEYRAFTEEDKREIFEIYGKIMILHRTAIELSINGTDKELASYISSSFEKINRFKKSIIKHVQKLRHSWEKQLVAKEELGYLG